MKTYSTRLEVVIAVAFSNQFLGLGTFKKLSSHGVRENKPQKFLNKTPLVDNITKE